MKVKDRVSQLVKFLREVRAELKKVLWPNRKETVVFTSVVVASVALVAAIFSLLDYVFGRLLRLLIR